MTFKPPVEDFTDADLKVTPRAEWAVGLPAIEHAMLPALGELDPARTAKVSFSINHKSGFDCPSCAWANPDVSKPLEFCENGMKSVVWESTPVTVPRDFFEAHSVTELAGRSEWWLGLQGRIAEPMYKAPDDDHYRPLSWDDALDLVADKLKSLDDPNEAIFYTSGRITNEPAFLFGLLARAYGTNNLPDCSNMCHEATGSGMVPAIGIGKSTVHYDDFAKADLVIVMGQNPGTNHPRMLNALQDTKVNGGAMVAVNPLPEASLLRYKNPQKPVGVLGDGIAMADQFLQIQIGGDMHLIQAIAKRVLLAEETDPGNVLDWDFINTYCAGFEEYRDHIMAIDDDEVLAATGLTAEEIEEVAERYLNSDATIVTWCLGITQHRNAVATIAEIMNLLFLKGNIGKPGAGASPVRGHSNVQGDRTMGIWEQMGDDYFDKLDEAFAHEFPRAHGYDSVNAMNAIDEGKIKVFFSMAGNLMAAMSDSNRSAEGIGNVDLTVSVTTKLNRSHVLTGKASLLLPVLGRTEYDEQATGRQHTTVEDTVCFVNITRGELSPVSDDLLSDVSVLTRLAQRLVPDVGDIDWAGMEADYDKIRDKIEVVIPGFDDFNERLRKEKGFLLPHGPRDSRTFPTADGKAHFTVHEVDHFHVPEGRLVLQTMRAHDQHNSTMYALGDRYRGIANGRFVVFVNPEDLAELGLADGQTVDIFSEWPGQPDRVLRGYRVVSYDTKKGCCAVYFPEGNALVPRESVAVGCNTPTSKQVVVRLEAGTDPVQTGLPVTH